MCRAISRSRVEHINGGFFVSFASPLFRFSSPNSSRRRWRRPRTEIGHGSPITPSTPTLKLVISPTPSSTADYPIVFLLFDVSSGFFAWRFRGSAGPFLIADNRILELEASRDLSKIWLHIDMDAFYAAVATLENPSLKGKPLAVGSMSMICTASYEVCFLTIGVLAM
ncbi:hypothetical protein B296_00058209 [Ensete ventricosum]|uniref:UmuC domain-containing protein n=1 Tax=Ensete ventricosum TaxID=4639 RepID=A0A426XN86_ENSVE|nr:hypothetical protein B296_00058209 [Ensete ventricosum]